MAKKILTAVAVVIVVSCILLAMFAGCGKAPEEEFELLRQNATFVQTESWYILKYQSEAIIEESGLNVQNSFISGYFADGIPVTKVYILCEEDGKQSVRTFGVVTEHEGPLVTCISTGEEAVFSLELKDTIYFPDYLRDVEYSLVDGQIVLS